MTVPYERYRSVINTEDFLYKLCNPKDTPRVPSEVRRMARSCLRHYPTKFDMERVCNAIPEVFEKEFWQRKKTDE